MLNHSNVNGAGNPCVKCGLSYRNTVHTNKQQFGCHEHIEREDEEMDANTKTEATHTPGPWHVNKGIRAELFVEHEHGFVCDMQLSQGGEADEETIRADARLIAAAPELLAALRDMLATVAVNLDDQEPEDLAVYEIARAAIRKAEGDA